MPSATTADGIRIEYETMGDPGDPCLLLVMGLGGQLIAWDTELCERFADRGFFVIRYDNRDVGLSMDFEGSPAPDLAALLGGDGSSAPYLLADMADDAVGLLDSLRIAAAHVVGVSMGGMIVQQLVIDHPERVLSLCSIMSTTGDPSVGQPSDEALTVLLEPPPPDRAGYLDHEVAVWRVISSPGYPFDEQRIRDRGGASYDRRFLPAGVGRQLAAIIASPDRTERLGRVKVPTLVIHGDGDVLVNQSGGRATTAAIPGAQLLIMPGMGHDLLPVVWDTIVDAVVKNTAH